MKSQKTIWVPQGKPQAASSNLGSIAGSVATLPDIGLYVLRLNPLRTLTRIADVLGRSSEPSTSPRAARRVMVVDDERDISMIFKSGLERNGFIVDVFNDPLDALSNFKEGFYDLMLLDIRMPRMSGLELYSEIKKKDGMAKACFVSAFEIHKDELAKYLPEEDGRCIVKKPVSMKDLVRIINDEISGKNWNP